MRSLTSTTRHLTFGLGILGGVAGFTVHGLEGAILWVLVGYFLGKAIQSTVWTVAGERTT